ncbi:23S rRNA (adenine(2503)-C(2))-methyltransferase RlmN [Caldicellulosiruptoraceae bacterium PP1]
MRNIKDLTFDELKSWLKSINEKEFRSTQIFDWIYKKNSESFDSFSNLPENLRNKLKQDFILNLMEIIKVQEDVFTRKYLMLLNDNNTIESVFMKYKFGNSICISTQVGCNMSCAFCASTIGGKIRNLTSGEMVDQIIKVENDTKERISSIVLMGSGEPFDNAENVFKFIEIVNHPKGKNIGARHITISTVGVVPYIYELANYEKQINLAISLHATNNKIREKLIPMNKRYPIEEIIEAIRNYINKTQRRVTIEYALIKGINDSDIDAIRLSELFKNMLIHVNLIPINEIEEKEFRRPPKERIISFYNILKNNKIEVTIRRELGSSISAACGQLRSKHLDKR